MAFSVDKYQVNSSNNFTLSSGIQAEDNAASILAFPDELVIEIFSKLSSLQDVGRCLLVCKKWSQLASDSVFINNFIHKINAFGCARWTQCFGEKAISHEDRNMAQKTLPSNIFEIMNSDCPAFPGKKVHETHTFVFIPKTINGETLTLSSFGMLAKKYFPMNKNGYLSLINVVDRIGGQKIEPGWRLMINKVLEESKGLRFDDQSQGEGITQKQCVEDLSKKAKCDYTIPMGLEYAVCTLSQYFLDPTYSIDSNSILTRCQDKVGNSRVLFAGIPFSGLMILHDFNKDHTDIGVTAIRRF
jgi:hypothetical protein